MRTPAPTEHHPRWYRKRVSTYWWLHDWFSLRFILREVSSVFVATFVLITLLQIRALGRGPEAYAAFQQRLGSPPFLALSAVSLLFVVFHTITWFNVASRVMTVRVRGRRIPDFMIAAPHYAAWIAASGLVAWVVLGR